LATKARTVTAAIKRRQFFMPKPRERSEALRLPVDRARHARPAIHHLNGEPGLAQAGDQYRVALRATNDGALQCRRVPRPVAAVIGRRESDGCSPGADRNISILVEVGHVHGGNEIREHGGDLRRVRVEDDAEIEPAPDIDPRYPVLPRTPGHAAVLAQPDLR